MAHIPRDSSHESSLALLREGNSFIAERCRRYESDVFQARLLLQNTLCMTGEEAARLFYDTGLFTREKAAPAPLEKTLFGVGGVQGLDGELHRVRKQMFMSLMTSENIDELSALADEQWHAALSRWRTQDEVVLLPAVQGIFCRAACRWADVPLDASQADKRCEDLGHMIDGSGGAGIRHLKARRARSRSETWISDLVEQVRGNRLRVDEGRALFRLSWHRDADDQLMQPRVAAVEVLNLLRPTVAIARFVVFAALALHEHPEWRSKLQNDDQWLEPFVQEVRRLYGFFPFLVARVRKEFDWHGYRFPEGTRVMLDLYGTNRDPRTWKEPEAFSPERYRQETINPFNFIPQGGGDHDINHRCPGEWFTIALMQEALRQLTRNMDYEVPPQDLHIDWSRMPIVPRSRFVISRVRKAGTDDA